MTLQLALVWFFSISAIVIGVILAGANAFAFWQNWVARRTHVPWVPVLATLLVAGGLASSPAASLRGLWWTAFAVDAASWLSVLFGLVWFLSRRPSR